MTSWHVHTAHEYPTPDPDDLETIGEQLAQHDAAVSTTGDRVHVDLTVQAASPLAAAHRALAAVQTTALRGHDVLQVELIRDDEADRLSE